MIDDEYTSEEHLARFPYRVSIDTTVLFHASNWLDEHMPDNPDAKDFTTWRWDFYSDEDQGTTIFTFMTIEDRALFTMTWA